MRHCWQIADIEFCAIRYGSGWLLSATLGMTELFEEEYREGDIEDIMDYTCYRIKSYSEALFESAEQFHPWEFL